MADLPLPQIREKKFRQQEIDLDQFTDEELFNKRVWPRVNSIFGRNPQERPREKDEEKT